MALRWKHRIRMQDKGGLSLPSEDELAAYGLLDGALSLFDTVQSCIDGFGGGPASTREQPAKPVTAAPRRAGDVTARFPRKERARALAAAGGTGDLYRDDEGLPVPDHVITERAPSGQIRQKLHFTVPTGASVEEELQYAADAAVAAVDYLPPGG